MLPAFESRYKKRPGSPWGRSSQQLSDGRFAGIRQASLVDATAARFLDTPLPGDEGAVPTGERLQELLAEYHRQRGWTGRRTLAF